MREVIINDDYLRDSDVDFSVTRAKAIIVNKDNKIILAHNNGTFQFPGGHVEEGEDQKECLIREIREEVGIENFNVEDAFLKIVTYDSHYFNTGSVVLNTIYYFKVTTDDEPDEEKTNYDLVEASTPFKLFFVDAEKLDEFLDSEIENFDKPIYREMKIASKEFNEVYKEKDNN